ncbi:hypothetical protein [Streptomyces katrae]|uniref:Uncharacterized protein n=1 Tax=Streptomyces katrae TaxID=68223 RepID=A0A0F4IU72_9ACTN|nr:hypothetical protein [Streptomyces katrae]KJY25560.1 hypothetical protein VR44_32175 [Streptomyces katrae]
MTDSTPHGAEEPRQSWVYSTGSWSPIVDPLTHEHGGGFDATVKAAGYEAWTGAGEAHNVPLTLTVFSRLQEPCFLFDLEGSGTSEQFFARTLPDALALLNQLAPTLQALAVTDQIARAEPKSMSGLADLLDTLHGRRRDTAGRIVEH